MKPDVFNSKNVQTLDGAVKNFLRKLNRLYMTVLDDMGVSNLEEEVQHSTGTGTTSAGCCATKHLYHHKRYAKALKSISDDFIKESPCSKEASSWVLGMLEADIIEIGSETADLKEWLNYCVINQPCSYYQEEYEEYEG